MGTRSLIAVQLDGKYRVAQYSQWDGYPEGQGQTCLYFLREKMDEETFKKALRKMTFIANEDLEALWREYGADEHGFVKLEDSDRMLHDHPQFSRDTGAQILEFIQNHPEGAELQDALEFVGDDAFCEWVWVIDLDKRTFEGFDGCRRESQPGNRFQGTKECGYHPPYLMASFSLDRLPDDKTFLAAFEVKKED